LAVALDVTDEGSVRRAFETAEQVFGRVDTVIANAGINIEGSALELDASALDDVFRVNVNRVFVTVREAARRLISAGSEHH
jgi:NAD(P)-dependent dehydrogenase (short-subunit alcohol dehydrogenase family)